MKESIKNKVREIQDKYCGESVETKLYYAIEKEIKETEKVMKLIEECNHWQPDYKFACVDKNKLKDLLDSK